MIEETVVAFVDVIGVAPGQTQPIDAIKAINAIHALDSHVEMLWVMVDGEKCPIERVELIHRPDPAYGPEAECNEIRLYLG